MTEQKKNENSVDGNTKSIRLNTWFKCLMCVRAPFFRGKENAERKISRDKSIGHTQSLSSMILINNIQLESNRKRSDLWGNV